MRWSRGTDRLQYATSISSLCLRRSCSALISEPRNTKIKSICKPQTRSVLPRTDLLRSLHTRSDTRPGSLRTFAAQLDTASPAGKPPSSGHGSGSGPLDGGDKWPGDNAEGSQQEAVLPEVSTSSLSEDVLILDVGGMHCGGCVRRVKRLLEEHLSVVQASVNLTTEIALAEVRLPSPSNNKSSEARKESLLRLAEELAQILQHNGFKAHARDGKEGSSAIKSIIQAKREERIQ